MTSRHGVRPLRLIVVAAVIALISTLFAATAAHAGTGSITGKVTKPSGNALGDSVVELYSISGDGYIDFEKSVKTRSDGTYTFGSLDRGRYVVGFATRSRVYATEFWNNKALIQDAAPISVGSSKVSSINAKLAVGGKVIGRVHSDDPNSVTTVVEGAEVAAYRYDGGDWTFGKSVLTSSDGRFTLGGLSEGRWTLEFNPPSEGPDTDLALEYWEDSRTFDDDDAFLVRPGVTYEDKEAHLAPGGRISGKVTGPDGEPVVDALVFGYPAANQELVGNVAFTDDHGNYTMTGLSPGEHRLEFVDGLEFDPFGDGPDYASEWWDNQSSFKGADRITVVAGETNSGKDAQLAPASAPLVNLTPPTIVGEAKYGEVLTAKPGTWSPQVHESGLAYRWLADGVAISGADDPTFAPQEGHLGKRISVEVTATRGDGQSVTLESDPTVSVTQGVLRNIVKPFIDSSLRVGTMVTFYPGEWAVPVGTTYQLLADGVVVPGAGNYHKLTPDLLGKKLSVRATAHKAGFEPVTVTGDETAPVTEGLFANTRAEVTALPIVGEPVETRLLNSQDFPTYDWQWIADGEDIVGADQPTFVPTSTEIGKSLTVRLTMSSPGYKTTQTISEPSEKVVDTGTLAVTPGVPTISGLARVGSLLTMDAGIWRPWGVAHTYEWLADGTPIPGAEGRTLTLTPAEDGKKISLRVTGTKPGYIATAATSSETAAVATPTPFGAPHGLRSTSSTATSIDLAWTPVKDAVKYRIYYGIGSGTRTRIEVNDVTSKTIKSLKPSQAYSIDIAALKADGTRSNYSPRISAKTAPLTAPTGLTVTERTPTTVKLSWTVVPGMPGYRVSYGIGSGTRTRVDLPDWGTTTLKGLKPDTTYNIDIASLMPDGTRSSYSSRINATTTPFLPPTDLASPGHTRTTIDVTWKKAPGAARYRLSFGTVGGERKWIDLTSQSSSYTIGGRQPGTTYSIGLSAFTAAGLQSAQVPPILVTTD